MFALPRRYWLAIFLFSCCVNRYTLNVNLSVAIQPISCQYNWSSSTQGMILSSFFFGSLFGGIPGGFVASKYGGKFVITIGLLAASLLTLLIPYAIATPSTLNCACHPSIANHWCFIDNIYTRDEVRCNADTMSICTVDDNTDAQYIVYILMACRILMGFFLFFVYSGIYSLINNWSPSHERSTMIGCTISGVYAATAFTSSIAALIVEHSRWENIFYFFGTFAIIWCIGWHLYIFESPLKDPYISKEELQYLKRTLNVTKDETDDKDKKTSIPWMEMMTNKVVLSIYICHFAYNWTFYTLLTQLPLYLNKELNYNLSEAGIVSIAPYIGQCIVTIAVSRICDRMIESKRYSLSLVRKIATFFATIIPSVLLVICGYLKDVQIIVTLLIAACSCMGFASSGIIANYSDISDKYSAIIVGVGNSIATLPGVISPIIGGYLLQSDVFGWKSIFYITFMLNIFGTVMYLVFAHANLVPELCYNNIKKKRQ